MIDRDLSDLTINDAFVRNLKPLQIPKEFTFHFINIILHFIRAVGPLIVGKLIMNYLIKKAKRRQQQEQVEDLRDQRMKMDAFFLHDYWMRIFSLIFVPTFLYAWI